MQPGKKGKALPLPPQLDMSTSPTAEGVEMREEQRSWAECSASNGKKMQLKGQPLLVDAVCPVQNLPFCSDVLGTCSLCIPCSSIALGHFNEVASATEQQVGL
jgi:hypothetical protein